MLLNELARCMDEFGELDPKMPLRLISTFLIIAQAGKKGCTMKYIANRLNIAQSATSRQVSMLSENHFNPNKKGFGLVETTQDPDDWRQKIVTLTLKGQWLVERLESKAA